VCLVIATVTVSMLIPGPVGSEEAHPNPDLDPLVADRPDFTESPVTIWPGRVQIETGFTSTQIEDVSLTTLGELLLRWGVVKNFELRLGLNSFAIEDEPETDATRGVEDIVVGLKFRILTVQGVRPELAVLLGTSLPTGSRDYRISLWQPLAAVAAGWELSSRFALGANLGYGRFEIDEEKFEQARGSLSLGFAISESWGCYLETFGLSTDRKDGTSVAYVDGGFTFLAMDDLMFEVHFGQGLNGLNEDYFLGLGAVIRFGSPPKEPLSPRGTG
jgi:hypothetical protein